MGRRSWMWAAALLIAATPAPSRGRAGVPGPPTPEEARDALRLADASLTIELVAAEPLVVDPVAIAWDEDGRLIVAEMNDYPAGLPSGRVKRLEDRDDDGSYEQATVFAEGLPCPSGVLPWGGGVLITAAPDLLLLRDTDGDGRADERRVVLTGFAEGNQQLRVNSPTWGLDNWVYLANGRGGGLVRRPEDPPEKGLSIPRHDLRVRPDSGRFEPVAGFSQFGLARDDWGDRFPSWNTVPLRHVVLEDSVLRRNPHLAEASTVAAVLDPADGGRVYPLVPPPATFNREPVSSFNASCGPTIYRGDLLGAAYRGDAFVCEPLTGLVHRRVLEPAGPTFVARRAESGREFLSSTHPWFRPVNLATGPDGALYVVDFCRAWVEHPAYVPEPLRAGIDFRAGHDRGRIWRIRPRGPRRAGDRPQLSRADPEALVALLAHPNGWWRDTAQRLLVGRRDARAVATLRALARSGPEARARVHALWTLEGLAALDDDLLATALRDPEPRVREQAARLAEGREGAVAEALRALADDPDARVRFRGAIALGALDGPEVLTALARIAARDAEDEWIRLAILCGLRETAWPFLRTLLEDQDRWLASPTAAQVRLLSRAAAVVGARGPDAERVELLGRIGRDRGGLRGRLALLVGLADGLARAGCPLPTLLASPSEPMPAARDGFDALLEAALSLARSDAELPWVRVLAVEALTKADALTTPDLLIALLEPRHPQEVQSAAARGLAGLGRPGPAARALGRWGTYTLATRRALLAALTRSAPLAAALLEAVERGEVPPVELDPATREALRRLPDPALHARVEAFLRRDPPGDRGAVLRRYEAALGLPADPRRGAELFARHCQDCHRHRGQGHRVGPDLSGVAGRPKEALLTDFLDPGREVAPDYLDFVLVTRDGQVLNGLIAEETATSLRLRRAEGAEDTILRSEVDELRATGQSLMPTGLEQVLGEQDVADLIDFLRQPGS